MKLTVDQVAARLNLHPTRIRQFCQEGRLGKYDEFARRWIITEAELKRFTRRQRPTGRPRGTPKSE